MKVYFIINEYALTKLGYKYLDHFLVSIYSCIERTNLNPVIIYDGKDNEHIKDVQKMGAKVIYHELSFKRELLEKCNQHNIRFDVASATFLKTDISLLEDSDDYVLFCDSDVMFLNDIDLSCIRPKILASTVGQHYHQKSNYPYSTGVMIMNTKYLKQTRDRFVNFILNNKFKTSMNDPYDQGHFNDFYNKDIEFIPQTYDWRPFWGINKYAHIVHWHGLKYSFVQEIIKNRIQKDDTIEINFNNNITSRKVHRSLFDINPDAYKYYSNQFEYFISMLRKNKNMPQKNYSMDINKNSKNLLVNSSKCVRWHKKIKNNTESSKDINAKFFIGFGGAPLWNYTLLKNTQQIFHDESIKNIFVLTPDYRYGNESVISFNNKIFDNGYASVNSKCMDINSDYLMLYKLHSAIKIWIYYFGDKIKFIFWNELARNVFKRLQNQPHSKGNFIMSQITDSIGRQNIIDMKLLLTKCKMDNVIRLFLDDNAHPTGIGYRFLKYTLNNSEKIVDNLNLAIDDFVNTLMGNLKKINYNFIFIGNSVYLLTLLRYLGVDGIDAINRSNLFIYPNSVPLGFTRKCFLKPNLSNNQNVLVNINDNKPNINNEYFDEYLHEIRYLDKIHFNWENIINKTNLNTLELNYSNKHEIDKIIDQSPHLHPSEYGLMSVIKYLTNAI